MCNKNSTSLQRPPNLRTKSMINRGAASKSLKPARKSRSKTRKPKFLSLRLELSQQQQQSSTSNDMSLNLFPLHPENMVDDDSSDVAFLFHTEGGATLNGLLTSTSTATTTTTTTTTMSAEEDSISMPYAAGYSYSYRGRECSEARSRSLVRTAMRNRERDTREEERWVCYSEVVEKKEETDETSSSCVVNGDFLCFPKRTSTTQGLLSLKLDYQGILNAWSDKGSLYIHAESPQTVPDLQLQDRTLSNVCSFGGFFLFLFFWVRIRIRIRIGINYTIILLYYSKLYSYIIIIYIIGG